MKGQSRCLVLVLLIGAALGCYCAGFTAGLGGFLGAGVIFELLFWLKFFKAGN